MSGWEGRHLYGAKPGECGCAECIEKRAREGWSAEYLKARDAVFAASRVYVKAQERYRAREIGDDEFLAARAVYKEAEKAFDVAWDAEARS